MPTLPFPSVLKPIQAYLRRAEELDHDTLHLESKLVAFYCRQYAMEKGLELHQQGRIDQEGMNYLMELMDLLEKEKQQMPNFTKEEVAKVCEDFARKIFQQADNEDREGHATKDTAKTFYAAVTFFEILKQFNELSSELSEKCKYAKYKAVDILKCIKEGRQPLPGGPEEESTTTLFTENEESRAERISAELDALKNVNLVSSEASPNDSFTIDETRAERISERLNKLSHPNLMNAIEMDQVIASPTNGIAQMDIPPKTVNDEITNIHPVTTAVPEPRSAQQPVSQPVQQPVPQPAPLPVQQPAAQRVPPPAPQPIPQPIYRYPSIRQECKSHQKQEGNSTAAMQDAMEYAKFAIAAMKINDINLARERLEKALERLHHL